MMRQSTLRVFAAAILLGSVGACSSSSEPTAIVTTPQIQLGSQTAAQLFAGTPTTATVGVPVTITLNLLSAEDGLGRCVNLEIASVNANVVQLRAVATGGAYTLCSAVATPTGAFVVRVPRAFSTPGVYTVEVNGVDTAGKAVALAWSITVS